MKVLDGLYYTEDHDWIKVEGNTAKIGITDFAQHSLGSIVFVELPEIDTEVASGDSFGVVESVKAASDIYSPVSGTVTEVNDSIVDDPALLNEDAYENWMIAIELSDKTELENLMNADAYKEFASEE